MRRPRQTKEQRAYARKVRAVATLRKAAVRYTDACELGVDESSLALTDLLAAANRYTETLTTRERRQEGKR